MSTQARGYAATPGTGPAGETCATCKHCVRQSMGSSWFKCAAAKQGWTRGVGTDIRTGAPACRFWEQRPDPHHGPRAGRLHMEPWKLAPEDPPCALDDPNQLQLFGGGA